MCGGSPQINSAASLPVAGAVVTPNMPWPVASIRLASPGTRPITGRSSKVIGRSPAHSSMTGRPSGCLRYSPAADVRASSRGRSNSVSKPENSMVPPSR